MKLTNETMITGDGMRTVICLFCGEKKFLIKITDAGNYTYKCFNEGCSMKDDYNE